MVLQERWPRGRITTRPAPALAPALAAFPRAAFAPTTAPVDFLCTRDGRARRFVHVVVARLVGTECTAGVSTLPASLV
jgi:hypothetical protein